MSGPAAASAAAESLAWSSADLFVPEDDVLLEARRQAHLLGGTPPSASAGAVLRLLAAATGARSVVEVGTGTGVSGVWLLRGMHPDGILTSVDLEPEQQRVAREIFAAAGFPGGRVRMISDYPLTVLPRLADSGYDLVYLDVVASAGPDELGSYLTEGVRLLRPGGLLVVDKILAREVSDPHAGDPHAVMLRELCDALRADEGLLPALLPVGEGLLCAVRRG